MAWIGRVGQIHRFIDFFGLKRGHFVVVLFAIYSSFLLPTNSPLAGPQVYKEDSTAASGSGSGIVLVARTSTGCVLGGAALGQPRVAAEATGR